jgi:hypothetical protein
MLDFSAFGAARVNILRTGIDPTAMTSVGVIPPVFASISGQQCVFRSKVIRDSGGR